MIGVTTDVVKRGAGRVTAALDPVAGAGYYRSDSDISIMDVYAPLKPVVFYILLALAERDSHGYAVMRTVRERSEGQVPLRTGSFYRHLGQLIDAGLVEETPRRPADADSRRGAYYRLTPRGRERFEQERRRLVDLVAVSGSLRRTPRKGHV
jgi:DNA-binding PadR family transcriptional regulator